LLEQIAEPLALDQLPQPGHLLHRAGDLIQHVEQPDQQLACRLPVSYSDRLRLAPIRDRTIPNTQKTSCSPPRHHLNAYLPGDSSAFRQLAVA
jgi:hypothetical protein